MPPLSDSAENLVEPYDHVNVPIAVPETSMKKFIAWDLEREHGDLGLGSSSDKPPLSPLGVSLKSGNSVEKHANGVFDDAGGNIGLARARLDLIHRADSLDSIETRRDQLPPNIVDLFDSGLKSIEQQPPGSRDIALGAIARAASHIGGVRIPELRDELLGLGIEETRSGEDVLEAAKGWLLATTKDNPQRLAVYHQSFYLYIAERYNQAIHRASIQLEQPRVRFEPQNVSEEPAEITPRRLARSTTMQVIKEDSSQPFQPFLMRKGTRAWQ